jgi:hypothetical protein
VLELGLRCAMVSTLFSVRSPHCSPAIDKSRKTCAAMTHDTATSMLELYRKKPRWLVTHVALLQAITSHRCMADEQAMRKFDKVGQLP